MPIGITLVGPGILLWHIPAMFQNYLARLIGREAGFQLREDINTVLEPGMVISLERMLTVPE